MALGSTQLPVTLRPVQGLLCLLYMLLNGKEIHTEDSCKLNKAQYLKTAVNTQVCIGKQFDYLMLVVLNCQKWHMISFLFLILSQSCSLLIFEIFP
jgi:hypothetical protein